MRYAYQDAGQRTGYWGNYFLRDVKSIGGVATVKKLVGKRGFSDGLLELQRLGRLDLTVEAIIQEERWHCLFTPAEGAKARQRLRELDRPDRG